MLKTEYIGSNCLLKRDAVEYKEYAEVYSSENQEIKEWDGAGSLKKVLDRANLNRV